MIYKATGSLRAIQILLGHSKIENTVKYLGVDVVDAPDLAEHTEILASAAPDPAWPQLLVKMFPVLAGPSAATRFHIGNRLTATPILKAIC